jgi:hypothetical protein
LAAEKPEITMEHKHESPPPVQTSAPRNFLGNPIVLVAAVLVIAAGTYFLFLQPPIPAPSSAGPRLPFGPGEQAYAAKLQFSHFAMSRAENFLHQEVTIISGDVFNAGDRTIRAAEVTIAFHDDMNQVVLRETRPLFPPHAQPLEPGKSYHFEISFDHVPPSWNIQVPSVRVSGLQFANKK